MVRKERQISKYPRLGRQLPPHLHARLQAASTVLGVSVDSLIETSLEAHIEGLEESTIELIDRIASETMVRTEND